MSLVTTFLIGVLYFFFFTTYAHWTFKSRTLQLKENRGKYERLQADVASARAAIERLPELEAEVTEVHKQWGQVSELLPAEKEIASFLTRMTIAGQESGVHFSLVEPRAPEDRQFYIVFPTSVQVDGGYHEVGRFLAEVGNLSRIVQVRNLEMIANGDIGEDGDRQVTATFMAETYGSKRNSGEAAAARGSNN